LEGRSYSAASSFNDVEVSKLTRGCSQSPINPALADPWRYLLIPEIKGKADTHKKLIFGKEYELDQWRFGCENIRER
jgi:hypothetical protein